MDKELEEAQNLTKDDLVAKLKAGRPAELARHRPGNVNGVDVDQFFDSATISVGSLTVRPGEVHVITVGTAAAVSVS